jgi:hypothetical protein
MIVVHDQKGQGDANYSTQHGSRKRPLVDGYPEDFENGNAK